MNSREEMVREIKDKYGLASSKVLSAMSQVPREEFVLPQFRHLAYSDSAISIGHGQTISQPYTVAFMTHLLDLMGNEKVLEIGTGSGYQAAVLSLLADRIYTIERIAKLGNEASRRLKRLGFKNIEVKIGSGEMGWEEKAPFDAIIVTAGLEYVPDELVDQLKTGGVLVAPVGVGPDKIMTKLTQSEKGVKKKTYGIFHFVPFVESN